MSSETATHNLFDPRHTGPRDDDAGLVLVYAPSFEQVVNAIRFDPAAPLVLGREPPAGGVCVAHGGVSRLHARIHRRADGWVIKDLDSRNGTFVEGARVDEHVLRDLDEIRIGDAVFKFVAQGIALYLHHRIDGSLVDGAVRPQTRMHELIGGAQMQRLTRELEAIAQSDLSVVILGETGTGKEVAARAVHAASGRKGPFCAVNCAAIPMHLLESELFGYKRGAFSGADRDKVGLVRAANGGTLLLDEIGDMPLDAQAKVLRMIETREVLPLGATSGEKIDVRLVSATHRELPQLVEQGKFRGDLYARIHGYGTRLPPLRARKEDVFLLARHFLEKHGRSSMTMATPFVVALCLYDFPYNVRELEATIRRAIALVDAEGGDRLDVRHLPEAIEAHLRSFGRPSDEPSLPSMPPRAPSSVARPSSPPRSEAPSADELRDLLMRHRGNVAAIARELSKDRVQIHRWMKRYALDPDDFR